MASAGTETTRAPLIDALRGLAILGVILTHTKEDFRHELSWPVLAIAEQGGWGVQLFFVLSALTLAMSWNRRQEPAATARFLVRRFFRIAPMFYVALALYLWIDGFAPRFYAPRGVGMTEVIATVFFLHGWLPTGINSIVPGGWSIAAEANFYLLFPFLARGLTTVRRALAAFCIALGLGAVLTFATWHATGFTLTTPGYAVSLTKAFLTWWLPTQLPVFLIGFVVYAVVFGSPLTATRRRLGPWLAGGAVVAGIVVALIDFGAFNYLIYGVLYGIGVSGLCFRPYAWFANPVLVHIGKVSYSAYFLHWLLQRFHPIPMRLWLPDGDLGLLLHFAWMVALTTALSTLTYHLIEEPGIAVGRRLARRLGREDAPTR